LAIIKNKILDKKTEEILSTLVRRFYKNSEDLRLQVDALQTAHHCIGCLLSLTAAAW